MISASNEPSLTQFGWESEKLDGWDENYCKKKNRKSSKVFRNPTSRQQKNSFKNSQDNQSTVTYIYIYIYRFVEGILIIAGGPQLILADRLVILCPRWLKLQEYRSESVLIYLEWDTGLTVTSSEDRSWCQESIGSDTMTEPMNRQQKLGWSLAPFIISS